YLFFFIILLRLLLSSLFPYTTLFRSPILVFQNYFMISTALPSNRFICPEVITTSPSSNPLVTSTMSPKVLPAETFLSFATPSLRSEEHTSELQSRFDLVCRLLLEKKK